MGRHRQPFHHVARVPVAEIALPAREPPPPESVQRLAQTLRRQGQREPVLVAVRGEPDDAAPRYRLVVGLRRLLAVQALRWRELDAVVLEPAFAVELAVVERMQAGDFEPFELAETLRALQRRCEWTQTQVGTAIGRNRDFVAGLLALTAIVPEVRAFLEQAGVLSADGPGRPLSVRHLRYIGRTVPRRQMQVAQEIVEQGLSVKGLEQRLRRGDRARAYIKVRPLRQPGRAQGPRTTQEWRRYYRKLSTELRRVDEQERHALRQTTDAIAQARQRQQLVQAEARTRRRTLARELRRATRQLERRGSL